MEYSVIVLTLRKQNQLCRYRTLQNHVYDESEGCHIRRGLECDTGPSHGQWSPQWTVGAVEAAEAVSGCGTLTRLLTTFFGLHTGLHSPLRISIIFGSEFLSRYMKTRSVARAWLTTCTIRNIVNMILTSD